MATRTARVIGIQLVRGDDDNIGADAAGGKVKNYIVSIDNNATVVTTGADTLNCDIGAAITGNNREGKTVTLRSVSVAKPVWDSKNLAGYAATVTISTNTAVCTIVQTSDWATGITWPANAINDKPLQLFVTVNEV